MSDPSREQQIRELAFRLWQEAGEPQGEQDWFWHAAAKHLEMEGESPKSDTPAPVEPASDRPDEDTGDSFPASDPPSNSGITGVKSKRK